MGATEAELAWAAGFFDGEGSVMAKRHGRLYKLRISIGQVDLRPLLKIQGLFGGSIYRVTRNEQRQLIHQWVRTTRGAATVLKAMLPYLIVKKEVAELGIQLQAMKGRGPHRLAQCEVNQQKWYAEAIKSRNARGVKAGEATVPPKPKTQQLRLVI